MLITLSGLDGAGKSTLIEWLRATLEEHDRPVVVFHMNDHIGIYAYVRALRDGMWRRGERAADATAQPVSDSTRWRNGSSVGRGLRGTVQMIRNGILWNKVLRRIIYPVDLVIFLCYRLYVEWIHKRVLLMDRYFYDTLVDVSDGHHWQWIRLLERITPTPNVPILLDICPEESYQRKGEYSLEYLHRRWIAYKTVFPWVQSAVMLSSADLEATKAALHRVVAERISL